jgi:pimeloyl-ACP methyl ester carboxylesterase
MRARGLDPAAFSTATNAADLADLRRALGYDRWDIYGASYGARLALEAMRRDPHGIRAATLENPLPPGPEDADAPLATQNALQRVFAACGRSPACDSAFPGLERTFLEVFDTLVRTTLTVPATEASARDIALDGDGLALAVRRVLRSREGIASLPLLLHELHAGDRAQAARELVRLAEGAGSATRAVFWLVQCYDQYGPDFTDRLDTVRSMVWRPLRSVRENFAECPLWQTESAKPDERAPLVSDIPTLILTGEFDARTPIEFGRRIASTLSNAYVFEFPGETHGGRPVGCRASILVQFLADPLRAPDASCIERMPSFEFRTGWAGGVSRDDPSV